MPLPHFLMMIAAVILAAGMTIWASLSAGVPLAVMGLIALSAAALVRLAMRTDGRG